MPTVDCDVKPPDHIQLPSLSRWNQTSLPSTGSASAHAFIFKVVPVSSVPTSVASVYGTFRMFEEVAVVRSWVLIGFKSGRSCVPVSSKPPDQYQYSGADP